MPANTASTHPVSNLPLSNPVTTVQAVPNIPVANPMQTGSLYLPHQQPVIPSAQHMFQPTVSQPPEFGNGETNVTSNTGTMSVYIHPVVPTRPGIQ